MNASKKDPFLSKNLLENLGKYLQKLIKRSNYGDLFFDICGSASSHVITWSFHKYIHGYKAMTKGEVAFWTFFSNMVPCEKRMKKSLKCEK